MSCHNRKAIGRQGDYFPTPKSLVWCIESYLKANFSSPIFEPCCGEGAIVKALTELGYKVVYNDLHFGGVDYLTMKTQYKQVITNPPFSLWDAFVAKAKTHCDKFMFIGRLNYLSTTNRSWENLKRILIFNRYVDYQTPYREDGFFYVGAMATGWFHWEKDYVGEPMLDFVDVNKYSVLGNYKDTDLTLTDLLRKMPNANTK